MAVADHYTGTHCCHSSPALWALARTEQPIRHIGPREEEISVSRGRRTTISLVDGGDFGLRVVPCVLVGDSLLGWSGVCD